MEDQFNRPTGSSGEAAGAATKMKEEAVNTVAGVKQKAIEVGRQAVEKIDAQREPAADALNRTASALHQQGEKASGVAHTAADKLQSTANYLRENDVNAMVEDVGDLLKRYPSQSLIAAAALGFLVGRLFQNND